MRMELLKKFILGDGNFVNIMKLELDGKTYLINDKGGIVEHVSSFYGNPPNRNPPNRKQHDPDCFGCSKCEL